MCFGSLEAFWNCQINVLEAWRPFGLIKNVFWMVLGCFFGSSTQNHAESLWNYVKTQNPKRAKLDRKSEFGYVQWLSRSPGPTCPEAFQEDKSLLVG